MCEVYTTLPQMTMDTRVQKEGESECKLKDMRMEKTRTETLQARLPFIPWLTLTTKLCIPSWLNAVMIIVD